MTVDFNTWEKVQVCKSVTIGGMQFNLVVDLRNHEITLQKRFVSAQELDTALQTVFLPPTPTEEVASTPPPPPPPPLVSVPKPSPKAVTMSSELFTDPNVKTLSDVVALAIALKEPDVLQYVRSCRSVYPFLTVISESRLEERVKSILAIEGGEL